MPRHPRLDAPGSFHHVMNRGARKQRVFGDDDSYLRFLELLAQLPARFGVRVHAFALMPNHFHLLLEAGPLGLRGAMQFLQGQYSRWLNAERSWDGPVWRSRYTSRLIEDEPYLGHVLAYIHRNPVAARVCTHEDQARWTSHPHYTGDSPRPSWLTTSELLEVFGGVALYRDYLEGMRTRRQQPPEGFDPDQLWGGPVRAAEPLSLAGGPEASPSTDLEGAWRALEAATGRPRAALVDRKSGAGRQGWWWLTLWWLRRASGLPMGDLAEHLGVHRSALSRASKRLAAAMESDAAVTAAREALEAGQAQG